MPDLLERDFTAQEERDFTAQAPNQRWVADFTYVRCWEGLVFFAFILDASSRMTVGWELVAHMRTSLVQDALGDGRRPAPPRPRHVPPVEFELLTLAAPSGAGARTAAGPPPP